MGTPTGLGLWSSLVGTRCHGPDRGFSHGAGDGQIALLLLDRKPAKPLWFSRALHSPREHLDGGLGDSTHPARNWIGFNFTLLLTWAEPQAGGGEDALPLRILKRVRSLGSQDVGGGGHASL